MTPAEQLAAAEAELAAHKVRAAELAVLLTEKRAARDALDKEIAALDKEYQATGSGWQRYGNIQAAERKIEAARRLIADESAPKVQVEHYDVLWVLVSATPKQVKLRLPGEVHPYAFTLDRGEWRRAWGDRLLNYDHDAAMRWYAASKKEKK